MPPLLNDFVSLQKDAGLVSILGVVEALRQAQIDEAADFNYTPYVVAALLFLLVTIPLTRFTDRSLRRQRAPADGGVGMTAALLRAARRPQELRRPNVVLATSTSSSPGTSASCLIGASGSGKSTLLRCVNLLEPIDDGVDPARRRATSPTRGSTPTPSAPRIGHRVPGVQPVPAHDACSTTSRSRRARCTRCRASEAEARALELLERVGLRGQGARATRTSSPAGSSSASPSRARWR